MFYDVFYELCRKKNVSPTRAALDIGLSKSTPTAWKNRKLTPQAETLGEIASYFGVSVGYLLGTEPKEKAPAANSNEREMDFNDFTYAMQNEAKELTEADKALLLSMARQLKDARKQKDGEAD